MILVFIMDLDASAPSSQLLELVSKDSMGGPYLYRQAWAGVGAKINDIFIYINICMCMYVYVSRSLQGRSGSGRFGSLQGSHRMTRSWSVRSGTVLSCPALSCPVLSCPVSLPILFPARFSLQVVTTRMVSMRGPPYAVSSFAKKAYWLNAHTMCEPTEWEDSGESITPNQHAWWGRYAWCIHIHLV